MSYHQQQPSRSMQQSQHQHHHHRPHLHAAPVGPTPETMARSVFVGDLSFFCTEIDLAAAFAPFGRVLSVEIKRGRFGDSLMHGFVEFESEACTHTVIHHMHGKKFMGRTMRVNRTNVKVQPNPEANQWIQVHVNFQCPDVTMKVSEELLESVFLSFGSIGDITVKRHLCVKEPLPQVSGYAFVYFLDAFAALRATSAMKNTTIHGVHFDCCLSYKAEQALMRHTANSSNAMRQQSPTPFSKNTHVHHQNMIPIGRNQKMVPRIDTFSQEHMHFFPQAPPSHKVSPNSVSLNSPPCAPSSDNYFSRDFKVDMKMPIGHSQGSVPDHWFSPAPSHFRKPPLAHQPSQRRAPTGLPHMQAESMLPGYLHHDESDMNAFAFAFDDTLLDRRSRASSVTGFTDGSLASESRDDNDLLQAINSIRARDPSMESTSVSSAVPHLLNMPWSGSDDHMFTSQATSHVSSPTTDRVPFFPLDGHQHPLTAESYGYGLKTSASCAPLPGLLSNWC